MSEKWMEMKKGYWPPKKDQLLVLILLGLLLAVIAVPVEKQESAKGPEEVLPEESEASETDYGRHMEERLE